jgi:outer membrane protein
VKPIQDEVYVAVKQVADTKGVQVVLERSSGANIIYFSPKIDISDEVLEKLGYAKQ